MGMREGLILGFRRLGSVEEGMMGSVVELLHSTGQTQVISSSQERTRHSGATEDPHVWTLQRTVLCEAGEEVPDNFQVNSSWQTTI